MSEVYLISDAAKRVKVEAHVLRYWEDELELPIKRNELGHRYYTEEDVNRFKKIKNLKERGLQLKAIRMLLKDGKLAVLPKNGGAEEVTIMEMSSKEASKVEETSVQARGLEQWVEEKSEREEKLQRLQWLLKQLFSETLKQNNAELCNEMKDTILKELDYQFRMQEEREEERVQEARKRDEEHFQKLDELLRKKRHRNRRSADKKAGKPISEG